MKKKGYHHHIHHHPFPSNFHRRRHVYFRSTHHRHILYMIYHLLNLAHDLCYLLLQVGMGVVSDEVLNFRNIQGLDWIYVHYLFQVYKGFTFTIEFNTPLMDASSEVVNAVRSSDVSVLIMVLMLKKLCLYMQIRCSKVSEKWWFVLHT